MPDFDRNIDVFQDIMPEGSIPLVGMRLISYLDSQGAPRYKIRFTGEAPVTEIVGLLEMVQVEMITRALNHGGE